MNADKDKNILSGKECLLKERCPADSMEATRQKRYGKVRANRVAVQSMRSFRKLNDLSGGAVAGKIKPNN